MRKTKYFMGACNKGVGCIYHPDPCKKCICKLCPKAECDAALNYKNCSDDQYCKDCVCFRPSKTVDHAHCVDEKFYSPRDTLPNDGNIIGCRNWRSGQCYLEEMRWGLTEEDG